MIKSSPTPPTNFSKEAVRGTLWNYFSFFFGKVLNFISTIILARLLVPEQFGLVGYCTLAIQYIDILNTAGMDSAIIARRNKPEEAANSAFVASIGLGFVSFGLSWIFAPQLAAFFKEEQVIPLFRILSLSLLIGGISLVPDAILRRNLAFRDKVIVELTRNLLKGAVSIILALMGWGPWSLVIGQLVGELTGAILYWLYSGWRPSWVFDPQVTKEVMIFGFHIILLDIAAQLRNNVDYIIVGRLLGPAMLGLYTMAYRIPELIIGNINQAVGSVSFSLLARAQSNLESLRSIYSGYIRYIALVAYLVAFGLFLVSDQFVKAFLPEKWHAMIQPMSLIAIAFAISAVGFVPGVLYKAIGRPDILNRLALGKLPFVIGILLYCSRWGITGVAAGHLLISLISVAIDTIVINRMVKFSFRELFDSLYPAIASSVIMVIVVSVVQFYTGLEGIVGLLVYTALGAGVYGFVLSVVNRQIITDAFVVLRDVFSRRRFQEPAP